MQRMQALINEGRKVRDKTKINLRTPMSKVVVVHSDGVFRSDISSLSFLLKDELNLIDVEVVFVPLPAPLVSLMLCRSLRMPATS
jgi:isoleucyl-tRNA synthetase